MFDFFATSSNEREVVLFVKELPHDNNILLSAAIAALAVMVSGLLSAYIVRRTSLTGLKAVHRNELDGHLIECISRLAMLSFSSKVGENCEQIAYTSILIVSKQRYGGKELILHLENIEAQDVDDFHLWKSELLLFANTYFTSHIES